VNWLTLNGISGHRRSKNEGQLTQVTSINQEAGKRYAGFHPMTEYDIAGFSQTLATGACSPMPAMPSSGQISFD
jgi:uncharacterized membrane-anchored protein